MKYRVTDEQLEMFLELYKDPDIQGDPDAFHNFLVYSMAAELKELRMKVGLPEDEEFSAYLLTKICSDYQKGSLKHSITKRELQRKVHKKLPKSLDEYTNILQELKVIQIEVTQNSGRPTIIYNVNPEYLKKLEGK